MSLRKNQHIIEAPNNIDVNRFRNPEVKRFFLQMSGRFFIQECGFKSTMSATYEIWDLVQSHQWKNFCATLTELMVDAIIYEFYASIKDRESHK
ncbi:hypothetical protein PVK06_007583 [Gossypium arboreum]|uniref:Uncharacterized protein n=1 Tax=Gossypium arboreum TaxID=29729 RepID=A0ABR0QHP0_GOSAR|nr:hypothetical protein PVK06_007583 [Gossypium arboreum]